MGNRDRDRNGWLRATADDRPDHIVARPTRHRRTPAHVRFRQAQSSTCQFHQRHLAPHSSLSGSHFATSECKCTTHTPKCNYAADAELIGQLKNRPSMRASIFSDLRRDQNNNSTACLSLTTAVVCLQYLDSRRSLFSYNRQRLSLSSGAPSRTYVINDNRRPPRTPTFSSFDF